MFRKNLLVNSLTKNISINSYGLIDFDKSISSKFDYYCWDIRFDKSLKNRILENLLPDISDKTIIKFIKKKINAKNSIDNFRKEVLDSLISLNPKKYNFIFFKCPSLSI